MNVKEDRKKILLGVTGGVAAYKSCELTRLLTGAGYDVTVVLTAGGSEFVGRETFQALSGNPVGVDGEDARSQNGMDHIALARGADLILIAPATANTLAKIAGGLADNLLLELVLARDVPLAVAPAMNHKMWSNPATQRNVELLKEDGVVFWGPEAGDLACGEVGVGRMLEPAAILDLINGYFTPHRLSGKKVLLTAGATTEAIDPVRCLTNLSSGKMGLELARACRDAGARVTLIHGDIKETLPANLSRVIAVQSAEEMYREVHHQIAGQDVFISVAAVSDYRVKEYAPHKIKKKDGEKENLILELVPNPDILASVAQLKQHPLCVGFAAESERVVEYARAKRIKKGVPLIIANDVASSLGQDTTSVYLIGERGEKAIKSGPKRRVAGEIVAEIANYLS